MRTWGRVPVDSSNTATASGFFRVGGVPQAYEWVEVVTDANGQNDAVWLTTLAQTLQLGLGEDPIFGNYGIPAQQSVVTEVLPDYYVTLTQQLFASYFLSLTITRLASVPSPFYQVDVLANPGAALMSPVPI